MISGKRGWITWEMPGEHRVNTIRKVFLGMFYPGIGGSGEPALLYTTTKHNGVSVPDNFWTSHLLDKVYIQHILPLGLSFCSACLKLHVAIWLEFWIFSEFVMRPMSVDMLLGMHRDSCPLRMDVIGFLFLSKCLWAARTHTLPLLRVWLLWAVYLPFSLDIVPQEIVSYTFLNT